MEIKSDLSSFESIKSDSPVPIPPNGDEENTIEFEDPIFASHVVPLSVNETDLGRDHRARDLYDGLAPGTKILVLKRGRSPKDGDRKILFWYLVGNSYAETRANRIAFESPVRMLREQHRMMTQIEKHASVAVVLGTEQLVLNLPQIVNIVKGSSLCFSGPTPLLLQSFMDNQAAFDMVGKRRRLT